MHNHLSDQELIGHIHHTLADAQREVMEQHLAACADCRARLSDYDTLRRNIRSSLQAELRSLRPSPQMTFAAIQPHLRRSWRFTMVVERSRQLVFSAVALAVCAVFVVAIWTLFAAMSQPPSTLTLDDASRVPQSTVLASPGPAGLAVTATPSATAAVSSAAVSSAGILGGQVQLEAYELSLPRLAPGAPFTVTLYWRALREMGDYDVYVHLLDASGSLVAQHDGAPFLNGAPAGGARPTGSWDIGEQVVDVHVLQLPADLGANSYSFRVGMYAAATGQSLGETSPRMAILALPIVTEMGSHTIAPGDTLASIGAKYGISLRQLLLANGLSSGAVLKVGDVLWIPGAGRQVIFGGQVGLAGAAWREGAQLDHSLAITLYWRPLREITGTFNSFVHLLDGSLAVLAQHDTVLTQGARPAGAWETGERAGEQIADPHTLALPADVAGPLFEGEYDLGIGLYDSQTGERLLSAELPPETTSMSGGGAGSVLLGHLIHTITGTSPETDRRASWRWPVNNGTLPYEFELDHRAWDWDGQVGEVVRAVATGTVRFASWSEEGYGYLVTLEHADGLQSWYAHLQAIAVEPGQTVYPGDQVGAMGSTGNATGVHLHFEVRNEQGPLDPAQYLEAIPDQ